MVSDDNNDDISIRLWGSLRVGYNWGVGEENLEKNRDSTMPGNPLCYDLNSG